MYGRFGAVEAWGVGVRVTEHTVAGGRWGGGSKSGREAGVRACILAPGDGREGA